MIKKFIEEVILQTGQVHQVQDYSTAGEILAQIAADHQLKSMVASTDEVIRPLKIMEWANKKGIEVKTADNFKDRASFKDYAFGQADAGITGVNYGISESGTLCLVHDINQPRLASIAPLFHIAILTADRLVPEYEQAVENIYTGSSTPPSQVSFITGPSMTGDIKAQSFKGMHGPKHLIIILIE